MIKKCVPWYKLKNEKEEIGCRLVESYCWTDLVTCDRQGKPLRFIASFSHSFGYVLLTESVYVKSRNIASTEDTQKHESSIPYFKVWHSKPKAKIRLRLRYERGDAVITAVDTHGIQKHCGCLMDFQPTKNDMFNYEIRDCFLAGEKPHPFNHKDILVRGGTIIAEGMAQSNRRNRHEIAPF